MQFPKVTVTVPTTFWRYKYLHRIIKCFINQTYPNKELVILDTDSTPEQSKHIYDKLLRLYVDNNTIHYHYYNDSLSIGIKRNILASLSSGQYICHFDDDDYYYPEYITTMYSALDGHDFIKLASYTLYKAEECTQQGPAPGHFSYWNFGKVAPYKKYKNFPGKYGYGFTYFYDKKWIEEIPMEDMNLEEDSTWLKAAMRHGIMHKYILETDKPLTIHTIHSTSTSGHWSNSKPPWDIDILSRDYKQYDDLLVA